MKSKGILIVLIISLGVNLGALGTFAYYAIRKANHKLMWKEWEKRYDKTWAKVQDSLDLSPELTREVRARLKKEADQAGLTARDGHKVYRDSLVELMKQPELDTLRLRELLAREEGVESDAGFMLYKNLFETKKMLPEEKQEEFIDFFEPAIKFTGKPWYIFVPKKEFHKERARK